MTSKYTSQHASHNTELSQGSVSMQYEVKYVYTCTVYTCLTPLSCFIGFYIFLILLVLSFHVFALFAIRDVELMR